VPPAREKPVDWHNRTAPVNYYALALTWSPEYCETRKNQRADQVQCALNQFGFVVHGLWPNAANARAVQDHPRHCRTTGPLPADLVRRYLCMMPSVELMQNEWQAHGSCAFDTPAEYFDRTAVLWQRFSQPDLAALARAGREVTAGEVKDAIVRANAAQGLTRSDIVVFVGSGNWLREAMVCYDRNWRAIRCPMRGTPDRQPIRIRQ